MKNNGLRNATRAAQRTQAMTLGYFGGYIGKRQPAGTLETKKCVDKLFTLREKTKEKAKQRSSGRHAAEWLQIWR